MSFLVNAVGSGAGIIVIAVTFIAMANLHHLPGATHNWIRRFLIILMYGGDTILAYSGIGALWNGLASWIAGWFGGLHAGIPHVTLVVASCILIVGLVVGLIKAPVEAVVVAAALVPAVLMLTSYGFIHTFWLQTSAPAQQLAAQFNVWLGG